MACAIGIFLKKSFLIPMLLWHCFFLLSSWVFSFTFRSLIFLDLLYMRYSNDPAFFFFFSLQITSQLFYNKCKKFPPIFMSEFSESRWNCRLYLSLSLKLNFIPLVYCIISLLVCQYHTTFIITIWSGNIS